MASYNRLGAYLLASELAEDAFGKIYRGLSLTGKSLDKYFLIRTFSEELVSAGADSKLEASNRVASLLAGTRGLGSGYHFVAGDLPYIACDYVPGRSLAQLIAKAKEEQIPLGVDHALSILQSLAQALVQMHSKGVPHGILSPSSVWVSFEGAAQILDAPYADQLQDLVTGMVSANAAFGAVVKEFQCPAAHAAIAAYAPAEDDGSPLQQDFFALGAIFYELLTFDKLPSQQIAETLAKATLKASQENAPIPADILGLLKRLLMVESPFETPDALSTDLERVLYDGDYSPTTFNMAFFMHTLFREENEQDNQAMSFDQTADFASYAAPDAIFDDQTKNSNREMIKRFAKMTATLLVIVGGGFFYWNYKNTEKNRMLEEELKKQQVSIQKKEDDLKSQEERQKKEREDLERRALAAKTETERLKIKQEREESERKNQELSRRKQQLEAERRATREKTIKAVVAKPVPVPTPAPTPAPAPVPAASAPSDAPAHVTRRADPRSVKASVPESMKDADVVVSLKVFVDAQGKPLKVIIQKGMEGYNDAAHQAAISSAYAPAVKDGKPTTGWVNLSYNFGKPN